MTIKAISLMEPWASLMRCGVKTVETRSWKTKYRGPLLICASKRWDRRQRYYLESEPVQQAFRGPTTAEHMLCGKAVAIVILVDCVGVMDDKYEGLFFAERHFGDFSPGRYCWVTNDLRAINPFPVVGQLGLFDVELPVGTLSA